MVTFACTATTPAIGAPVGVLWRELVTLIALFPERVGPRNGRCASEDVLAYRLETEMLRVYATTMRAEVPASAETEARRAVVAFVIQ